MRDSVDLIKAVVERLSDDMICTRYKNGFVIEEADAKEIDDVQFSMTSGKDMLTLVDLLNIENKVSKEAKDFFTKKGKMLPFTKGVAIVQNENQSNLPSGLFANWTQTLYPTKTFSNRHEAILWLRTL